MNKKLILPAGLIALIAVLLSYQTVFAHVNITVGDYEFEIGWVDEPPIVGQQNAILVNVTNMSGGKRNPWKTFHH